MISKIFYIFFFHAKYLKSVGGFAVFLFLLLIQFRRATFQGLSWQMWLVVSVLGNTGQAAVHFPFTVSWWPTHNSKV